MWWGHVTEPSLLLLPDSGYISLLLKRKDKQDLGSSICVQPLSYGTFLSVCSYGNYYNAVILP